MFFLWAALSRRPPTTALYMKGEEWKIQCLDEEEAREGAEISFRLYGHTITMMTSFLYLEQTLKAMDDD